MNLIFNVRYKDYFFVYPDMGLGNFVSFTFVTIVERFIMN